jgi:hypothetical protein
MTLEVLNIAEKRPQKKPKGSRPDKKVLKVEKGATVEFPVRDDHSHAEFQELAPVEAPEDLAPFVPLWHGRAQAAEREFPGVESLFGAFTAVVADAPTVARLQADDFVVPAGSTVVLTSPLNHLQFDNVEIKGDLVCQGDLVLECNNFS